MTNVYNADVEVMSLEDIIETIKATKDSEWFINFFEIGVEDLAERFPDFITANLQSLPFELEMLEEVEEYEDR